MLQNETYIYRLKNLNLLKADLTQLWLEPAVTGLSHHAGQYLEILYPDNSFQPFSIANAPTTNHQVELHIRCSAQDPATAAMLARLRETATITIRGPFGKAFYRKSPAKHILLLAGGTGFAYAKALIEQMIIENDQRTVHLYWGVKTPADFYLDALPKHWLKQLPNFRYTPIISKPQNDTQWSGKIGYIPQTVVDDYPDLTHFQVYASGPFGMVKTAYELLQKHGLRSDLMFSDML